MKLERIISIIMILLQKDKKTAKELAEMFEVSLRTIYRDIETINIAGIPISTAPGVNGGLWIMPEYKLNQGIFTKDDLVNILIGSGVLASTFSTKESTITTTKIRSLVPKEMQDEITLRSDFVSFNFSIRDGEDLKELIDVFYLAVNLQKTVVFNYCKNNLESSKREIEPYKLIFQSGYWYIQGYCLKRKDFRIFKLSRMWDADITANNFNQRGAPKAFNHYNQIMRDSVIKIELIVDSTILSRILDFCSKDNIIKIAEDKYKVIYPFIESDYDYGMLIGFGDKCQCVSPPFVRKEIKKRLSDALAAYDN